jgi:hypothetical protein
VVVTVRERDDSGTFDSSTTTCTEVPNVSLQPRQCFLVQESNG